MSTLKNKKLLISSFLIFTLMGCDSKVSVSTTTSSSAQPSESSTNSVSTSVNNNMVTVIEEKSSSFNGIGNIISTGANTIVVNGNKAFLNGKEVDMDTSNGVSLSYDGDKQLINGKPVKFKNSDSGEKHLDIQVTLTGEAVKIPVNSLSNVNSSFDIEQKCSDSHESYFLIDSALKPYLKESQNGTLRLKEGKYTINGKLNVVLFTPALDTFKFNSSGTIILSCVDKKTLNLDNEEIGSVVVNNLATDVVHVTQSGVGNIVLNGEYINQLYATNSGVGNLKFNVNIKEGHVENSGVGSISAKNITQLDAINSGIGNIDVNKADKIIRSETSSLGHINVND